LIPKKLYENISKLNKIRNLYVHNLDVDFTRVDLNFHDPEGRVSIKKFKSENYFSTPPTHAQIRNVVAWIGVVTFGWIHKSILEKFMRT
jgi:hypothetical protein